MTYSVEGTYFPTDARIPAGGPVVKDVTFSE
jgi:hypothetical protein